MCFLQHCDTSDPQRYRWEKYSKTVTLATVGSHEIEHTCPRNFNNIGTHS